jgi:hypothetical protein
MYGHGGRVHLDDVRQAISRTMVPGVRNLTVRESEGVFEILGEADTQAERENAFRLLSDKLGAGIVNAIRLRVGSECVSGSADEALP